MDIAWALIVVSSEGQAETLVFQRAWAEAVCRDKPWHLSRVVQGVASGKDGPRRLSQDVLLEVRATPLEARPKYLLMTRLDRVGRGSIVDSQIFVRDLFTLGVRVFTRDQGEVRLDSAMDELIAAVQMAVARHENDVRRDKSRAVYRRRRESGAVLTNRAPYGLWIDSERVMRVLESHHETLKTIFRMRIAGERVVDIEHWLQANAPMQTFARPESKPYFVHWTTGRLAILIANRSYCGTAVDEATWLRAQRTSQYAGPHKSPVRKHGVFPLGGILRCVCGRGMCADAKNVVRNPKRGLPVNRVYSCRAHWHHGGKWTWYRADVIEQRFRELLRRLAATPGAQRSWAPHGEGVASLDLKTAAARAAIERIETARLRAWALAESGRISEDDVVTRLEALRLRRGILDTTLVRLLEERVLLDGMTRAESDVEDLHRTAYTRFLEGDAVQQAAVARAVVISLGGLRVAKDGFLLTGRGADTTPQRRRKKGEII